MGLYLAGFMSRIAEYSYMTINFLLYFHALYHFRSYWNGKMNKTIGVFLPAAAHRQYADRRQYYSAHDHLLACINREQFTIWGHQMPALSRAVNSFSTYLASMSTSRFTGCPTAAS